MMDIGNLRYVLKMANITQVSKETGIHQNTLYKIRDGVNKNPKVKTVEELSKFFRVVENG